jgi:Phasin protein
MADTGAKKRKRKTRRASKISMLRARDETRRMRLKSGDGDASTARAATDLMRGQFETVQRAWEVAAEAARNLALRPIEQLSRASGFAGRNAELGMQESLRNVESVMGSGTVVASAIHNISRELVELTRVRLQQSMRAFDAFANCRSPEEVVKTQNDFVRHQINDYVQSTRRMADISVSMADDAADKTSGSLRQR